MAVRTGQPPVVIDWSDDALDLRIDVDENGMARMTRLLAPLRPQIGPSGSAAAHGPSMAACAGWGWAGAEKPLRNLLCACRIAVTKSDIYRVMTVQP